MGTLEQRVAVLEALLRAPSDLPPQWRREPSVAAIAVAVADAWGIALRAIHSDRREQPVALARQVAMHLARRLTGQSFPAIGRALGRDHSTVMHGHREILRRCAADPALAARVEAIAASLSSFPDSQEAT